MKYITYITLILVSFSCKAQTIIPMYGGVEYERNNNYYLKDTNNVLNNYVGTWVWNNGNDTFTLINFKKSRTGSTSIWTV